MNGDAAPAEFPAAPAFVAVGECMLELSARGGDLWRLGFAGDTFNAAWYARALLPPRMPVDYVTAAGVDPFSEDMLAFMRDAGIGTERVRRVPDRRPGLYAISLSGAERTFTYWRGESAARCLADDPDWLDAALTRVRTVLFSGITLGILGEPARETLLGALARARGSGATVAFDTNFRPALWPDRDAARLWMSRSYRVADIVLPSFDDEAALFGDADPAATAARVQASGVREIVVKDGGRPSLVVAGGVGALVPATRPGSVVDTTGAGDSFAGCYLAARLMGRDAAAAARLAHRTAGVVVGARGALAPIETLKEVAAALRNEAAAR